MTESVKTLHTHPLNARMRLPRPILVATYLGTWSGLLLKSGEVREAFGRMVKCRSMVRWIVRTK